MFPRDNNIYALHFTHHMRVVFTHMFNYEILGNESKKLMKEKKPLVQECEA